MTLNGHRLIEGGEYKMEARRNGKLIEIRIMEEIEEDINVQGNVLRERTKARELAKRKKSVSYWEDFIKEKKK
jgi:hypothetical protein